MYRIEEDVLHWAFGLVRRSLQHMYESAPDFGGWQPDAKLKEMSDQNGRYVIAIDNQTAQRLGFLYFQFVEEESLSNTNPVLVIYMMFILSIFTKLKSRNTPGERGLEDIS